MPEASTAIRNWSSLAAGGMLCWVISRTASCPVIVSKLKAEGFCWSVKLPPDTF